MTRGIGISKKITLKLIIQGLLQIYNKDLLSNLTLIKSSLIFMLVVSHLCRLNLCEKHSVQQSKIEFLRVEFMM